MLLFAPSYRKYWRSDRQFRSADDFLEAVLSHHHKIQLNLHGGPASWGQERPPRRAPWFYGPHLTFKYGIDFHLDGERWSSSTFEQYLDESPPWKHRVHETLQTFIDKSKSFIQDARLDGTPVGELAGSAWDAGAAPAPCEGDIVVISSAVLHYYLWVRRFMEIQQLVIGGRQEFNIALAYQPDLANLLFETPGHDEHRAYSSLLLPGLETIEIDRDALFAGTALGIHFLILHEFAHVVLGHTDRYREHCAESCTLSPEDFLVLEYEADAFALSTIRAGYNLTPNQTKLMLWYLFSLLHFTEPKGEASGRHPSAVSRLNELGGKGEDLVTYGAESQKHRQLLDDEGFVYPYDVYDIIGELPTDPQALLDSPPLLDSTSCLTVFKPSTNY